MRARVLALALFATTLGAQQGSLSVDGGAAWKGLSVRFLARVEPGGSGQFEGSVIDGGVSGPDAQRFIDDPVHRRSFGYELQLEPARDGNSALLRIMPLRAAQHAVDSGWTQFGLPSGLPAYPAIPHLRIGDTVVLDLLVNPSTGQKVVDYLTLERTRLLAPAHDFTLADVQLSLDRPRVSINGQPVPSAADFRGGIRGTVVWLYVQGHGRFILSLFPNPKAGLRKAGTVAGTTLTFRDGATEFRVDCESAIAPDPGAFNVYVFHQPAWRPRQLSSAIQVGAAGDVESLTGGIQ